MEKLMISREKITRIFKVKGERKRNYLLIRLNFFNDVLKCFSLSLRVYIGWESEKGVQDDI